MFSRTNLDFDVYRYWKFAYVNMQFLLKKLFLKCILFTQNSFRYNWGIFMNHNYIEFLDMEIVIGVKAIIKQYKLNL